MQIGNQWMGGTVCSLRLSEDAQGSCIWSDRLALLAGSPKSRSVILTNASLKSINNIGGQEAEI